MLLMVAAARTVGREREMRLGREGETGGWVLGKEGETGGRQRERERERQTQRDSHSRLHGSLGSARAIAKLSAETDR